MLRRLLDRPVAVTMIAVVLVILGVVSSRLLPVSLVPDIDAPYITVQIPAQGVPARQLNETVVIPLSRQLIQLSQLTDIRSDAREGSAVIRLTFEQGADIDYLFIEVNEKIDRSISSLPRDLERPKVIKASATDIPAFYINLTVRDERPAPAQDELHPVSERFAALSRFASQVITKRIEQLPEVAMVDMSGSVASEILIIPDETKLRQAGITIAAVESALKRADVTLGSLTIRDGEYQYSVKFSPVLADREDIERIFLKINGRLFRVRDLAQVIEHPRKRQGTVLSDGRDAITLAVVKQSDARMSQLKSELDKLLGQFRHDYPDVEFTVTRDQTELLDYSISNLVSNIVAGALLACLIILFFMRDMKSPLLVILTIPVTLIVSVLVFYVLGISINIISLSGLVLGIGMMVDNSIIVIDNMTARWLRGERLADAVTRGTNEVVAPMLSSVLTTCAVFIPLIFINGMAGALFYDQAMAVTITLFVAYGVSITLLPVYYRWWYRRQEAFRPSPWLERFSFDRVTAWYETALKWFFRRRALMWGIYAVSIVGLVLLFLTVEKERLPRMTYSDMLVHIDWNRPHLGRRERPPHAAAHRPSRRTDRTVHGHGRRAAVHPLAHRGERRGRSHRLSEMPRRGRRGTRAAGDPQLPRGQCPGGPLLVRRLGQRLRPDLRRTGGRAHGAPALHDGAERRPRTAATAPRPHPRGAARTGGPAGSHAGGHPLRGAARTDGSLRSDLRRPDRHAAQRPEREYALHDLERRRIAARGRRQQPPEPRRAAGKHLHPHRRGRNPGRRADAPDHDARPEAHRGRSRRQLLPARPVAPRRGSAAGHLRDPAVRRRGRRLRGEASAAAASPTRGMVGQLVGVLAVALLLLFFILAAQFESLVQPWIILSEIVIDLFGAILVLRLFGESLNLMSMIGLIVVCGIVINDSILKIDTINTLRRNGRPLKRAILEAGRRRLKAIVMTSLTTILAVAPFLARGDMGSDLQFPMSLVIISGMTVGTLVSVLFIPLAYYEIHKPRR